jgi:hypothetical protein
MSAVRQAVVAPLHPKLGPLGVEGVMYLARAETSSGPVNEQA